MNTFAEFDALMARVKMTREELDAIWQKLPPFNLNKVKNGEHYIHRFDLRAAKHYCDVREIAEPNGGWLVWAGEWLPFMASEEDEMYANFRMYDAAAFEVIQ